MLASKLIEELQKIIAENGDVEIWLNHEMGAIKSKSVVERNGWRYVNGVELFSTDDYFWKIQ